MRIWAECFLDHDYTLVWKPIPVPPDLVQEGEGKELFFDGLYAPFAGEEDRWNPDDYITQNVTND